MRCGHCGCAVVAEIKKGRYVYYHCSGQKRECPEKRYAREEIVEGQFTEVIRRITLPPELVDWASKVLAESDHENKKLQLAALQRLQADRERIQRRVDAMYLDKLDGRITADEYDRLVSKWRSEIQDLQRAIRDKETGTSPTHLPKGIELLKLARNAAELFEKQPATERARLLKFVLSNSVWKDGHLTVYFRQPFDLFATWRTTMKKEPKPERARIGQNENWLLR
jgi:hypothetical protein